MNDELEQHAMSEMLGMNSISGRQAMAMERISDDSKIAPSS